MDQSTPPSLSQTIWLRWASRQFLTLPIVQTLLPETFGYSLISEAVFMRQLKIWKRLWRRSLTCSHERTSIGPFRNFVERYNIALQPGEINSTGTRASWVLSIKVPIRTKYGNLFNDPRKCLYMFPLFHKLLNNTHVFIEIRKFCISKIQLSFFFYHHHHLVEPSARISLTLSRYPTLLFIVSPYPHRDTVCRFELVALLLLGHVKGSIGVHHLWARPCFSCSALLLLFV